MDCHGHGVARDGDVVAAAVRRVADEGRRVEVEGAGAGAASAGCKVDGSPLEREEREKRGGSRGGGVS